MRFGSSEGEGFPLFPLADGSRPPKDAVISAWVVALGRPVKGHSGRRSGAKMRARAGWAVWMIQFFGRWASAVVLEYIEEALAQRTLDWSTLPCAHSASSSSSAPSAPQLAIAGPQFQQLGELDSLSERTAKAEAAIVALAGSLDAKLAAAVVSTPLVEDTMCLVTAGRFHVLPQGCLELPRPFWALRLALRSVSKD